MYLIGLDVGSTNWKAALYSVKGKLISAVDYPTPVRKDGRGNIYYDPKQLWKIYCTLIKKIAKKAGNPELIKAISIASMAEAGGLVDKNGQPVSSIIPWYDRRTIPQKNEILEKIKKEKVFEITGVNLSHIHSICKIKWFKSNEKKAFKKAAKWVCVPDYLVKRLSGVWATDYSIASRTALFDIRTKSWSKKMLSFAGIHESFLPQTFPPGTVVGNISKGAGMECGLSVNTKVVLGGHDHVVGSLGAGLFSQGKALDSIGTAESVCVPLNSIKNLKKYYKSGISFGCYTYGNMYYAMSGLYSAGGIIEWLRLHFYKENLDKNKAYKLMIKEADMSGPGSGGLILLPHWLGMGAPFGIREARGTIIGLTPETSRGDIVNAAYEGLSYEYRILMENIEQTIGFCIKQVVVIGGGSKNIIWLKRKANITGKNLVVVSSSETVCLGAALLAGLGSGLIKNPGGFIRIENRKQIQNSKKLKGFYADKYNEYIRIHRQIMPLWQKNHQHHKDSSLL